MMIVPMLAMAAACGGSTPANVVPEGGPATVVAAFMEAVADSNMTRMAQLWGTDQGSAAVTGKPEGYQRRIQIMHAFLTGSTAQVLATLDRSDDRVVLAVNLTRSLCRRQVSFTTVRTRSGEWLVNAIDLAAAGTPGQACSTENRVPPQ